MFGLSRLGGSNLLQSRVKSSRRRSRSFASQLFEVGFWGPPMVRIYTIVLKMIVLTRRSRSQHPLGRLLGEVRILDDHDSIALLSITMSISANENRWKGTNV